MLPVYILSVTLLAKFALNVTLDVAFANVRSLVKQLFTLADTEMDLDFTIFQVHFKRYERKAFFVEFADQTLDLVLVRSESPQRRRETKHFLPGST